MANDIHLVRIAVPKHRNVSLLLGSLLLDIVYFLGTLVKLRVWLRRECRGRVYLKLSRGIQYKGTNLIPVRLHRVLIIGWCRLPSAGLIGDRILGEGATLVVVVLFGIGFHLITYRLSIGYGSV